MKNWNNCYQFLNNNFIKFIKKKKKLNIKYIYNNLKLVKKKLQIIGKYPNTYTFTKSLCERVLLKRHENITVTI